MTRITPLRLLLIIVPSSRGELVHRTQRSSSISNLNSHMCNGESRMLEIVQQTCSLTATRFDKGTAAGDEYRWKMFLTSEAYAVGLMLVLLLLWASVKGAFFPTVARSKKDRFSMRMGTRVFARDRESIDNENRTLKEEIRLLEVVEAQAAEQYQMDCHVFDTAEILEEARARTSNRGKLLRSSGWDPIRELRFSQLKNWIKMTYNHKQGSAWEHIHKLYHLRLQYAFRTRSFHTKPETASLVAGPPRHVDASRFWVVLIGIDAYAQSPLRGCVRDAQLMMEYLTDDLGVPKDRIVSLTSSMEHTSLHDPRSPTRAHILQVLHDLITNPEIERGDNIIIYYSGHGTAYHCMNDSHIESRCNKDSCPIEALCPVDRGTLDIDGKVVPDISDREVNSILTEICRAKGHRITVILDACHSGSLTKVLPGPGVRRTPPLDETLFRNMLFMAEESLKHMPGYYSVLTEDWRPNLKTHVILAACREYQFAKEMPGSDLEYQGVFTKALVRALRTSPWKDVPTYTDILDVLDQLQDQTPVVAGKHRGERLWFQD